MIGNDVIDLAQTRRESNWQRRGFLDKLFTTDELLQISNHINPETIIWTLWSMKEAVYKIYNRQTGIRAFNPKKIVCKFNNTNIGTVSCNEKLYFTRTISTNKYIYTVATISKKKLSEIIELQDIPVIKDLNGLPYVADKNTKMLYPKSVSHHGDFYKIAALKIND